MIDYSKIEFDVLGEVILESEPNVTCTKKVLEIMVEKSEEELTDWWRTHLKDWEEKGIIDRS